MPTRPKNSQDDLGPDPADKASETHEAGHREREHDRDQDHGGYAERGPGRGDHPGRPSGERIDRESPAEREASDRSRWRTDDRDERSGRWSEEKRGDSTDTDA